MLSSSKSTPPNKRWCVMVYLAADVDLKDAAMADLEEMKLAGSSEQVDILAQLNPGGPRPVRRYHLQKDTYLEEDLADDRVFHNVNARQDLIDFITWSATRSKAEHYALILWGHGQGWKADHADPCFVPGAGNPRKSFREQVQALKEARIDPLTDSLPVTLLNGETGFLTNADLKEVLAKAKDILRDGEKKLDILGLDACLMAMGEVCSQVHESVDYLIASEDTVPDESWPYDKILELVVEHADQVTPEDFARIVVRKFVFAFGEMRKPVTQSICQVGTNNSAALEKFTSAVKELVAVLVPEMSNPETRWATMIARGEVQSFFARDYVDLYDFCRLLSVNTNNEQIRAKCDGVMKALSNDAQSGLVLDMGTFGHTLRRAFGLSIYFPSAGELPPCYAGLEFCRKTNWHEFLKVYLKSPGGRRAVLDSETEWPSVVIEKQPVVNEGVSKNAGAPVAVATTPTTTDNNGANPGSGNGIKTTHGDEIKTTHGDPIKAPMLPFFLTPKGFTPKPVTRRGSGDDQ